jgi:hypothetical protein
MKTIVLAAVLVLIGAAHAVEPAQDGVSPPIRVVTDTVAAMTCRSKGFKYFERRTPDSPWVICVNNPKLAPRAIAVSDLLDNPP